MKCKSCEIDCDVIIPEEKKFCPSCHCSYLVHVNYEFFGDRCFGIVNEICCSSKSTEKTIEESCKLAKTFGTVWLPLGIQPSEVDRFLKFFPTNTDIRRHMLMKSDTRYTEVQWQLPFHDRAIENLRFLKGEGPKRRAEYFFNERRIENCNVARIDHLDRSEGNTCSNCHDSMGFGEVCVMLPKNKKMSSDVWHPHCFKCITCKHLLIDYLFCWDVKSDVGPYCLRHFDDIYNARCASCDEMIFDEKYPSVMDESYHIEHLCCSTCDIKISDTQFVLESDMSIAEKSWKCVSCLKGTKKTYCGICKEIIEVCEESITMQGLLTHKSCVKCLICLKDLSMFNTTEYIKEKNYLFCLNCNNQRNPNSCSKCNGDIDPESDDVVADGLYSWHKSCLVCFKCQKGISNGKEFAVIADVNNISRSTKLTVKENVSICKDCFTSHHVDMCDVCHERINNSGVKYNSRLFHKSCFLCHECSNELNPSEFTTKDDHVFCPSCYGRLFCKFCSYCTKPILGYESCEKMISFENRNWHEKCFICTNCQKSLIESGFLFDNEKIICVECDVK